MRLDLALKLCLQLVLDLLHYCERPLLQLINGEEVSNETAPKRDRKVQSHLLIALGAHAAQQGHRVKYVLAAKLASVLVEAADDRQLSKTIARYGRVDLLCLDELGYMELDRRGAELLFQVLTEREETNSVAIASNESFSGWTRTFTDPRLCAAIVDRLTFAGNIIETGTVSYRLAHARAQRASR